MTVRELIKSSLRLIGAIAPGETPTASEEADCLSALQLMIDALSIDGDLGYKTTREEFALVASQSSRTMGSGGNFSTTRPTKILNVGVEEGTTELPVEIITAAEWANIRDKSTTGTNPSKIYVEGTNPLETLNFYPIPTSTNNLVIYSQKPLTGTLAISDSLTLPPGYDRYLKYTLAIEIAPEFGKQVDPLIMNTAIETTALIKRQNTKPAYMESDLSGLSIGGHFNIKTGEIE